MNVEDKTARNTRILNNTKKQFEVSAALVLRKEIWVVVCCGYVTSSRHLEHIYRLHLQRYEKTHNLENEDAIFHSRRRKFITQHHHETTQKAFFVNTTALIQIK